MHIDRLHFEFICRLTPDKGPAGQMLSLLPQKRYKNARNFPLHAYGIGPFCKFRIPKQLKTSGVYALVVEGSVKYIGECISLSARYNSGYGNISPRNCYKGGQETNCRINALIRAEYQKGRNVELWFHPAREHKRVEKRLLSIGTYEWNR